MALKTAVLVLAASWVTMAGAQSGSPPSSGDPGTSASGGRMGVPTLEHVAISQVVLTAPDLKVYLDARGAGDMSIDALPLESIQAWMDGKALPVRSLKPFSDTHEGIAYVFLVDVSRSESRAGFATVQQALKQFINQMGPSDKAAIISFGEEMREIAPYTGDKATLDQAVSRLLNDAKMTHLNAAIVEGLGLAQKADSTLPSRRSLVVLSDGKDEGSGLTTDDVLRRLEDSRIPIYAIGASNLPGPQRALYLEVLHRYAVLSGGAYYSAPAGGIGSAYKEVHDRTARVWVADLNCSACTADGAKHTLGIRLNVQGQALADKIGVMLLPAPPVTPATVKPQPVWKRYSWKAYSSAAAGLALLTGLLLWLWRRGKKGNSNEAEFQANDTETPSGPVFTPYSFSQPEAAKETKSADVPDIRPSVRVELVRKEARTDVPRSYVGKLVDNIVVGRAQGSAIQIPDKEISGQHCRIEVVNGHVLVSDLGSTFGTSVNGIPVKARQKVESGDWIGLGKVEFRIRIEGRRE